MENRIIILLSVILVIATINLGHCHRYKGSSLYGWWRGRPYSQGRRVRCPIVAYSNIEANTDSPTVGFNEEVQFRCKAGYMSSPEEEWVGPCLDSQPLGSSLHCHAVCSPTCSEQHGSCIEPLGCDCDPGWSGDNCDAPICKAGCQYGSCDIPDKCDCDKGWSGDTCTVPKCKTDCNKTHGYCTKPDDCLCKDGWSGDKCDTSVTGCSIRGIRGNDLITTGFNNGPNGNDGQEATCVEPIPGVKNPIWKVKLGQKMSITGVKIKFGSCGGQCPSSGGWRVSIYIFWTRSGKSGICAYLGGKIQEGATKTITCDLDKERKDFQPGDEIRLSFEKETPHFCEVEVQCA